MVGTANPTGFGPVVMNTPGPGHVHFPGKLLSSFWRPEVRKLLITWEPGELVTRRDTEWYPQAS